ncbi:MAG: IS5 family transposase [Natronomonas sp.]
MGTTLARFTSTCVGLAKKATVGPAGPPLEPGEGGYADWVIVALHGLKEHLGHSYRQLMDVLKEMPRIRRRLGLSLEKLPYFTTLGHAKERMYMPNWRRFLDLTSHLQDLGEVQAIDASGFDRIAASRKYANRTNYTFKAKKTTLLVDCSSGTILDVHCSTQKPHDTKVARQLLSRNFHRGETITADKGYDSDSLRRFLQAHGVEPVIKHREFTALDWAQNHLQDEDVYHQRAASETGFRVIKQRFGDRLWARSWYGQFRELVFKCAVKNIEDQVKAVG